MSRTGRARRHRHNAARAPSARTRSRDPDGSGGGTAVDRPATAAGTASREALPQPRMPAGLVDHEAELPDFSPQGIPAAIRQLVVTALGLLAVPGVGLPGRLRDQAAVLEPLNGLVERARAEADAAVGPRFDILLDGIAVLRPAGQGEHDVENRERQRALGHGRVVRRYVWGKSLLALERPGVTEAPDPKTEQRSQRRERRGLWF